MLTLINNCVLKAIDFDFRESGAVLLTDTGRRTFLQKWQERKKETITHPFLEEKIPWGLVPYVQSLLLARYLRGDLDNYGQRVQNSVFECLLDTAQCRKLQNELCKIIDPEKDSLRFYYLGKKYENKIEHFGCKQTYLPEEPMIL